MLDCAVVLATSVSSIGAHIFYVQEDKTPALKREIERSREFTGCRRLLTSRLLGEDYLKSKSSETTGSRSKDRRKIGLKLAAENICWTFIKGCFRFGPFGGQPMPNASGMLRAPSILLNMYALRSLQSSSSVTFEMKRTSSASEGMLSNADRHRVIACARPSLVIFEVGSRRTIRGQDWYKV